MCGIVGYVGSRPCKELLLHGLERLEYRGYDSAGICLMNGQVDIVRRVGKVSALRDAVGSAAHPATTGLAHTRWATHGGVIEANAHPIEACEGSGIRHKVAGHQSIAIGYPEVPVVAVWTHQFVDDRLHHQVAVPGVDNGDPSAFGKYLR